jgi:NAD(P)-dependent dehydrogenase (short-subunit alcohol dehydrogenase family)
MGRLEKKVVIVTGGATGIGEAISKKFAREGAMVIVNGTKDDPVQDVVNEILQDGGEASPFIGDISEEEAARCCVAAATEKYGRLDVLVNNAGVFPVMTELQGYPVEAFDFLMKNNVRSVFLMTLYALPELIKTRGCIISAGSESGKIGLAENAPYGGTKGFIHAFMRGIAVEQAKRGVRANCVCPGPVDTAWTHKETGPMTRRHEQSLIYATPLGRRGTPEEIANVYLFLASEEASYITGALIAVDGGITISKGIPGENVPVELTREPEPTLNLNHTMEGATGMAQVRKDDFRSDINSEMNSHSRRHREWFR